MPGVTGTSAREASPLMDALPPLINATGRLREGGAAPEVALDTALALLALRVAEARNLLPAGTGDCSEDRDFADMLRALPAPPDASPDLSLAEAMGDLSAIPGHCLTPDLPGELYPLCLDGAPDLTDGVVTGRETRRRGGVFFTPRSLVESMLSLAWPEDAAPDSIRMLDPACGGGAFLLGAARHLRRMRGPEAAARIAAEVLHGVDRDPAALRLAARGLHLTLSTPGNPAHHPPERLRRAETLLAPEAPSCTWPSGGRENGAVQGLGFSETAARGGFDLVVGNPPYDVLTNFRDRPDARALAEGLRRSGRYPLSTTGQINLYRCFIERALALLRPGGTLVFVVPSGLLLDRAAAPLRTALVERHAADVFRLMGEKTRTFPGVTQSVVVFRCRRDAGEAGRIRIANNGRSSAVRPADLRTLGRERPCPPGSAADWALARWLARHALRRFDTIADGWVGEVDQTVYRRHMRKAPTPSPLARGTHCRPFRLDLPAEAAPPAFLDREGFLRQKGAAAGPCLGRVARERVAQLGIRNLETVPRLVAARVPPKVFLGNSLNAWIPRPGVPLLFLLGLLNARLLDWRFRFTSGNNNINLCEITPLPLPTRLPDSAVRRIARAAADCEDAALGAASETALAEARARLDRAVADLYHLPDDFREHLAEENPGG